MRRDGLGTGAAVNVHAGLSRPRWWYYLLLGVFFTLVGIVWCRPLHRYLFEGIPYEVEPAPGIEVVHVSPQDCLQLLYKYWLFSEFTAGRIPLFGNPYEFATPGERGFTGQQVPVSLVFAALRPVSPVLAYNVIMLLSFAGCGVFMAMLARRSAGDGWAAALAGLVFCIMPFRLPQLMAGHPNGVSVLFLPLTLFLVDRGLNGSRGAALGAGAAYASIAITDMQLAYFGALLIAAFGMYRMAWIGVQQRAREKVAGLFRMLFPRLLLMAAGTLPGVAYLVYMKLVVLSASALHANGIQGVRLGPAWKDLWDITIFGERRIYIGPYVAVFALTGLVLPFVLRRMQAARRLRADTLFWLVMVLGGLVLSLSLNPPFVGLVDRIPLARLSRTPARAVVITFTALAMLSAHGLALVREWLRRYRRGNAMALLAAMLCMGLVMHDFWLHGPRGINMIASPSPVYEQIAASTPDARVLAVPIWPGDSAMSSSLFHHIIRSRAHLINGYSPVASGHYRDTVFEPLSVVNAGQFGHAEWELARALGVTHVTFHPESFAAPRYVSIFPFRFTLERLRKSVALEWLSHHEPVDGFRLVTLPPDWSKDKSRAVVSPVGYSVPGVHAGVHPGRSETSTNALAGVYQTGMGGTTNAVFAWKGRMIPPGDYVMAVRLAVTPQGAAASGTPVAWTLRAMRMAGDGDGDAVATGAFETISGAGFGWHRLPVTVDRAGRIGFRIDASAPCDFRLDLCKLSFAATAGAAGWEAEALFHAGRAVVADAASGGEAVQLGTQDPEHGVVRGPYRFLPPGDYVAEVRYRGVTGDGAIGALARLQASGHLTPDSRQETLLAELTVRGAGALDPRAREWKTARLPFRVPEPGVILELRVDRATGASIEIDRFDLRRPDGETAVSGVLDGV